MNRQRGKKEKMEIQKGILNKKKKKKKVLKRQTKRKTKEQRGSRKS